MDFNRAGTNRLQNLFSSHQFRLAKWSFFVHSTTCNAPYVHSRRDLILDLCLTFRIGQHADISSGARNLNVYFHVLAHVFITFLIIFFQ